VCERTTYPLIRGLLPAVGVLLLFGAGCNGGGGSPGSSPSQGPSGTPTSTPTPTPTSTQPPVAQVQCGQILTSSVTLASDLICNTASLPGVVIAGDGVVLDGGGHQITAQGYLPAVLAVANRVTVQNLQVVGSPQTAGIYGENTQGLIVQKNQISGTSIGIDVYCDTSALDAAQILDNQVSAAAQFGLRLRDESGQPVQNSPVVKGNFFQNTAGYSVMTELPQFAVHGSDTNRFDGSEYGYYLSGGSATVDGMNFMNSPVTKGPVFAADLASFTLTNSVLSIPSGPDPVQERVALHLYRVGQAQVSGLTAQGMDVAVKLATDTGIQSQLALTGSTLSGNAVAGVWIQSYDGTDFGNLTIQNNDLTSNPAGYAIHFAGISQATGIGPSSQIGPNQE